MHSGHATGDIGRFGSTLHGLEPGGLRMAHCGLAVKGRGRL